MLSGIAFLVFNAIFWGGNSVGQTARVETPTKSHSCLDSARRVYYCRRFLNSSLEILLVQDFFEIALPGWRNWQTR